MRGSANWATDTTRCSRAWIRVHGLGGQRQLEWPAKVIVASQIGGILRYIESPPR